MKLKFLHIGMCATGEPLNGLQKSMIKFTDYKEINCGVSNLHDRIVESISEWVPDIVFLQIQAADIIKIESLRLLKSAGSFIINFTGDVRQPIPQWYISTAPLVDITLFSNEADVNVFKSMGLKAEFLQLGFDPEIYNPDGPLIAGKDIVFMANNYGDLFPLSNFRIQVANALRHEFGDKFGLYGSGWNECDGNYMGDQKGEAARYRGSKIAINCSHFSLDRYSSDRIYRILGSGALCLTKYYPGMDKDFNDKGHLISWDSIFTLVETCKEILTGKHELELSKLAGYGCIHAHTTNTFDHMIEKIILIKENYV
jgi:hypothetical protein